MEKKQEKKKLGLTTLIFISLLLGAGFGIILHYWIPEGYVRDTVIINGVFYVVGNGFLRAMQMLVVPLVFCSIVCGSMSIGDTKTLGKVGVKAMGFYLVTTALAITLALSEMCIRDSSRCVFYHSMMQNRKIYRKKIFVTKQRDSCTMETYCYMKMIRKTVMKTTDQMR